MSGNIILGVGINDSPTVIKTATWVCPYYQVWVSMLKRCYSTKKRKIYQNTTVCKEWLRFTSFKAWMETQDWQGKVLDKDLIGNSLLYSPDTSCFIYQKTNMFISNCDRDNCGNFRKDTKMWSVRVGRTYLGAFHTPEEANRAFLQEKHKQALQHAELYTCPRIKKALSEKYMPS